MADNHRAYNIWKEMNLKVRILLAVSVFLIFSTLGPLSILMDDPLKHISIMHVLIVTISSGGISGSIILFARKKLLLILMTALFMAGNIYALDIEQYFSGKTDAKMFKEQEQHILLNRKEYQEVKNERMLLGTFSVVLLALGYTMFIVTLQREGKQRVRLETEFQVARKIQESLNPGKGMVSGRTEVFGIAMPAQEVGGDFFDYLDCGDGNIFVLAADVSGHGIGSGIIAAMTKSAFYANRDLLDNPAELFSKMNRTLQQITQKSHFVTAAGIYINPASSSAKVITGGHHPVLHYRIAEKTAASYRTQNLALGMQRDFNYVHESISFEQGDYFLLYTDGIIEARNKEGQEFGLARLRTSFSDYSGNPPEIICNAIKSDLHRFTGRDVFDDDITLICVKT
ncbi:MAG: PP2C family protein-serine/threonine phosphatase [Ignavibacteriales bacterium]|nr:MAG: PP2C family protein-serine/threonine phosphatase [Ignavibacteriales bacterium]